MTAAPAAGPPASGGVGGAVGAGGEGRGSSYHYRGGAGVGTGVGGGGGGGSDSWNTEGRGKHSIMCGVEPSNKRHCETDVGVPISYYMACNFCG